MIHRPLAIMSVALLCSPCQARDKIPTSWGKPNVTLAQYKSDAVECAKRGYYRDVAKDEPAKQFIRGFRTADDAINLAEAGGPNLDKLFEAVLRTRPDRKLKQLQDIQVGDVEICLTEKGYAPFQLSKAEASALRRYPAGSEERRSYLHALASRERPPSP
jgi:hypothetical protein